MPTNAARIFAAEAIGTFALIFVGVLAIYSNGLVQPPGTTNLAAIGLAHGLTIGVMIASLGAISGGHFNPAVTFGFVISGRLKPAGGLMYWVAQLFGASIAGFLALAVVGQAGVAGGTPDLGKNVSPFVGIVVEAVLTFFLVGVIQIGLSIRNWLDDCAGHHGRRPDYRGGYEPRPYVRCSPRLGPLGQPLGLLGWSAHWRRPGRRRASLLLHGPGAQSRHRHPRRPFPRRRARLIS
jgi:hypothetical protein